MQKLSYIIILLLIILSNGMMSQTSPHGDNLEIDCVVCHSTKGWDIKESKFNHTSTGFELIEQHKDVKCTDCHTTLKFENTKSECESCHNDIHENSVGFNCENCHTPLSWVVTNITDIHNNSRFPLLGPHKTVDCYECHKSNTHLNFKPIGATCYECHMSDYQATTTPNHIAANYSTDCEECHSQTSPTWSGAGILHTFFPLTGGHNIDDCYQCHNQGSFEGLSQDCNSCHNDDFNNTLNPSHVSLGFSTDCQECHTLNGWQPATFDHDAKFFPIYSGKHNGEWDECSDCHANPDNYAQFSCLTCHEHNQYDTDSEHRGVSGYVYESNACFACHPTGSEEGSFSHTAAFPLTNSHSNLVCTECHTTSYSNTSSECVSCHQTSLESTQNPNHTTLVLSQQCEECHTATDWVPSTFVHKTTGFELLGSHKAASCSDCHTTNVANAVHDCFNCHQTRYDNSQNPNHKILVLSLLCEDCHNSVEWIPSMFEHVTTGFELIGSHATVNCSDCHTTNVTSAVQDCFSCHENEYTNAPDHVADGFPKECEICHNSVNWIDVTFDHDATDFPLTGAHLNSDCSSCHASGYSNISTECSSCHQTNFANTTNPSHQTLGLSNNCEVCHTTNLGWEPAKFPDHNNYYQLIGAHAVIASVCSDCHNGDYNNTPNSCLECHEAEYNNTTNPSHSDAQFPTNCDECHSQNAWTPATFNHDTEYFPIYSGKHKDEWTECSECHTTQNNYALFSCIDCHEHNQTDMNDEHSDVSGYVYESTACYDCHPNGSEDDGGLQNIKIQKMH